MTLKPARRGKQGRALVACEQVSMSQQWSWGHVAQSRVLFLNISGSCSSGYFWISRRRHQRTTSLKTVPAATSVSDAVPNSSMLGAGGRRVDHERSTGSAHREPRRQALRPSCREYHQDSELSTGRSKRCLVAVSGGYGWPSRHCPSVLRGFTLPTKFNCMIW